jgi:hypothetical protein
MLCQMSGEEMKKSNNEDAKEGAATLGGKAV